MIGRLIFAAEGVILIVLAANNTIHGRMLGASIVLALALLALGCAWALRTASR